MSEGILKMKSGIYKCPDNIKNFKFRVKLKKLPSLGNTNNDIDLNATEKEMKIFSWQEKIFSRSEAELYSKKANCFSELEKQYHEIITRSPEAQNFGRLFSYIQGDDFDLNEEPVTTEVIRKMTDLHKEMSNLSLRKKSKDTHIKNYEINNFLNNSILNPFTANSYETMYVIADLGDSEPNSNIWLKSEHVICRIKYDELNELLWVYPDFSGNENDTYKLETVIGGKLYYEYSIENISELKENEIIKEENDILRKINRRKQEMKTQILGNEFSMPLKNTLRFFIFFEILTAKNFEYDNLYVQYNIELPKNWSSDDENSLFGTTQTCKTKGKENWANFGHYFDVCLDYNAEDNFEGVPSYPVIYFQIISRDFWNRFRTEGLAYWSIPVFSTGNPEIVLQCLRILPENSSGLLKRYFIGDYFNIEDITWLGIPKENEGSTINKYGVPTIGTGTLKIRMNILQQSNNYKRSLEIGDAYERSITTQGRLGSSSLVKSVAEVLIAFRKARERMLEARKNILEEN